MAKKYPFDATMNRDVNMVTSKLPVKTIPLKKGQAVSVRIEIDDDLAVIKAVLNGSSQSGIVPYGSYDAT